MSDDKRLLRELRWPCAGCGRTDSLHVVCPNGSFLHAVVLCAACGREESYEVAARRKFNDGPKLVVVA